ncbi:MAG: LacI family DNA-binding transcriptional regulator [Betaproteobacteria bacterium]|nr:LacI family DNA-binding transcriptional regulator [Betaproteobacteria bacterium]
MTKPGKNIARTSRGRNGQSIQQQRPVRMVDVAQLAGVSSITVSRTLLTPELVTPATRRMVEKAIKQCGYIPNRVAGSLAANRSRTVAVIVPTISNSLFADTVQGITDLLEAHGYHVFLGTSNYDIKEEESLVSAFLERRADAMVLTGISHSPTTKKLLRNAGIPVVEMWNLTPRPIDMAIGFSNFEAARKMTLFLASRGYRKIGFLGGVTENNDRTRDRERGYLAALAELGIAAVENRIVRTPFDFPMGGTAIAALLSKSPSLDAVFAASDVLAIGAILECNRRGWPVPSKIAIAGMDDSPLGSQLSPKLTTVRIPRYGIGTVVGEHLIERLRGQASSKRIVDLGFEIVEREST